MAKNNLKKLEKIKESIQPQFLGLALVVVLTLCALLYSGRAIYKAGFFKVSEINSNVSIEPYLKDYIKGKSLLSLDIKKIHTTIAKLHPEYKTIQVIKEFPSSVRINISLRRPFAQLHSKKFYLLDKDRVVVSVNETNFFPKIILIEVEDNRNLFSRGSFVSDARLGMAFRLIDELKNQKFLNKFYINVINATFPETCYFAMNNTHVIIGSEDFPRKLHILENILNEKLKGDVSSVEYIDLRYKKAYVGYRQ